MRTGFDSYLLQRKIQKFLELKRAGKSFNEEVRKKKDYRNPDFLLHAVRYQDIDQIGSCFNKDVFDPHGFDKSDYYDEIEADSRRELERINQEKKNSQNLEFVSGGRQSTVVGAAPKLNVPLPGITMAATGLNSVPPAADIPPRDGRQNKKSKWDKIDGNHATLLPSANAGGYTMGGYMSLEYATYGLFSEKSDVFSFGAWHLWKEGSSMELMDSTLRASCSSGEVIRCIRIGLLCVQERAIDRPTMSDVVSLLSNQSSALPLPKEPAFLSHSSSTDADSSSSRQRYHSQNEVTISEECGR
ncbi:hypothetical protein ACLB2K_019129 [Fragaria x ananassa]